MKTLLVLLKVNKLAKKETVFNTSKSRFQFKEWPEINIIREGKVRVDELCCRVNVTCQLIATF